MSSTNHHPTNLHALPDDGSHDRLEIEGPKLSALLVNYESGPLADACLRSLRHAWAEAGFEDERLEVVVVDNGSTDDTSWLDLIELEGATVLRGPENLGYAGGIQRAFAETGGEPDDVVAILNPDVVFLPGSIRPLVEFLGRNPSAGAVAPAQLLDEDQFFRLPPIALPTTGDELRSGLEPRFPGLASARAAARTRRSLDLWSAQAPVRMDMLSGACMFLPRAVAESLDTLLDPEYPLYYEDADLCRRLTGRGFELHLIPESRILHHWSRSAGSGRDFAGEPQRRHALSRARYFTHYSGPLRRFALACTDGVARRAQARPPRAIEKLVDLGGFDAAPCIEIDRPGEFLLELAMTANWSLAAGGFVSGGPWTFPEAAWSWLFPGRYYLRAVERKTLDVFRAWTFEKTSAARMHPVEVDQLFRTDPIARRRPEGA
ncbi:MAG: glycosyltransferase family 2 protein [bacterium]|nr:glycosyltransferase family 2 protein [bacterium]